jgi:hypothetical protein
VERMNILQAREAIENSLKLFAECFRGELDFSCIEAFAQRQQLFVVPSSYCLPLILLILKPARICVGSRLWVRLRTMSMNSCEVGTGAIFAGSQLVSDQFDREFLSHLFPGCLHLEDVVAADLNKIADE